ncbi:hypothetical protein KOR42_20070 [Thalassoglobus neptunius]|uniref:Cytochrome C n=1 Tax=Thalassoglobus neptunius TaxID=1938619 RepID=A0A5C5X901_9PLAN|nr:hypothetical protein [Thalassoglobus neptunius]TWT58625.1 hypothetical protein KOR42_20070 [Thalassoglobus neptunius]
MSSLLNRFQILGATVLSTCFATTTFAEAPVPIESISPVSEIEIEVQSQLETLQKALDDQDGYEDAREGQIRQSFGLLACLGQALAEHDEASVTKIQGPALRDAALQFQRKSTLEEAKAALEQVKLSVNGEATGEHSVDHPWNKLINMHPMMEEMNSRNSALLKVLRRPRGKPEEPVHATTWAILALAMQADTHEVKDEAMLPEWNKFSNEFREASLKLAESIRKKDGKEGRKWFDAANQSCDSCHEVFQ